MQKIKTLKNKSGEAIYPLTSTKAVVDENGNTIEGRLVVADGEDLVTDGNVLRLKDRPNTDGMGYVILRKDKTFQEQVTKPNTIYEIRYDFDLGRKELPVVLDTPFVLPSTGGAYYRTGGYINVEAGMTVDLPSGGVLLDSTLSAIIPAPYTPSSKKSLYVGKLQSEAALGQSCVYSLEKEVVIPANCVLKFEGGSLRGGTLMGQKTIIESDEVCICESVLFTGTWLSDKGSIKWFGAKGNGIHDDTQSLKDAISFAYSTRIHIHIPKGEYVISDTVTVEEQDFTQWKNLEGVVLYGDGSESTIIKANIKNGKPVLSFRNVNNGTSSRGILFESFSIVPHDNTCAYKYVGLHLENSMGNRYRDISVTHALTGVWLTTKNRGYCEFNQFNDCSFLTCCDCIKFEARFPGYYLASFHGNKFYNCSAGIGGTKEGDVSLGYEVPNRDFCAINLEGGMVYNCVFDLTSFMDRNAILLRVNCSSRENQGNIRYEVSSDYAKVVTGDYAGLFVFNGKIYGYGNLNWDEAHDIRIGDIYEYNSDGTVKGYIEEGNARIGRPKLYLSDNCPDKPLNNIKSLWGSNIKPLALSRDITDIYSSPIHGIYRYAQTSGASEEGFICAASRKDSKGRLILGMVPRTEGKENIQDLIEGMSLALDGSSIISQNGDNPTEIKLNNNIITLPRVIITHDLQVAQTSVFDDYALFQKSVGIQGILSVTQSAIFKSLLIVPHGAQYLRPTEPSVATIYFDTTLNKPLFYTGTEWIEADGNSSGVKRAGTWSQRPNADGSYLENGFQYFLLESTPDADPEGNPIESLTGNGKAIWWIQDGRKWVDALGNTITGSLGITKVNEVRHLINGEEYKFLTTDEESHNATIYAPTELGNDNYVVAQQNDKAVFVDPADIGLK